MATALRSSLERLVRDFANEVLGALRTASLSDLASETGRGGGGIATHAVASTGGGGGGGAPRARKGKVKLGRRSAKDIAAVIDRVVTLLHSKPGLRAEQIRAELSMAQNELPGPITAALSAGRISKVGIKRATKYFAGKRPAGGGGGGGAKKAPAKKRVRRRGKK